MKNFGDKVIEAVKKKGNPICVGLDPRLSKIPEVLKRAIAMKFQDGSPTTIAAETIFAFNKEIIDAVFDLVPVVKLQIAFYEIFGSEGIRVYEETLKYAKSKGLLTIADAKRNDIGTSAEAYAKAFLGEVELLGADEVSDSEDLDSDEVIAPIFDADALTINAYLGFDGVKPFVTECRKYGKGIFVLVKTSNPSSGDFQDLLGEDAKPLFEIMGGYVDSWGADEIGDNGYSFVGAVVGATYPEQAKKLRHLMPNAIFLVPGFGAQGGTAEDVKPCFNSDGFGALINSSRGIIFAYERMDYEPAAFAEAARAAVLEMANQLKNI